MTADELEIPRWTIQPEPTADEFVALFATLRHAAETESSTPESQESRWAQSARREQLRAALGETGNGWNR